jgi:hypothetical protein
LRKGEGRYQPTVGHLLGDALALSGAVHWVRRAQLECRRLLAKAVSAFQPLSICPTSPPDDDQSDAEQEQADSEDEAAFVPPAE